MVVTGSIQLFTSLIFHPYQHLQPNPCKHANVQRASMFSCICTSLQLKRGQLHKHRSFPFSFSYRLPPPTHQQTWTLMKHRDAKTRSACKEIFLLCFSQSLLTFTFFNLPTHTNTHASTHTYTHKAHIAFPGHPAHPLSGRLQGQRGQDSPY